MMQRACHMVHIPAAGWSPSWYDTALMLMVTSATVCATGTVDTITEHRWYLCVGSELAVTLMMIIMLLQAQHHDDPVLTAKT